MMRGMERSRRALLAERLRHPPGEGAVLISIKPRYAELIELGEKRVEFRRRFPTRWSGGRALFYVTSPVRAVTMEAWIAGVRRGRPGELWEKFAEMSGVSRREFEAYFSGAQAGVALVLEGVRRLEAAVGLDDPRLRAIGFRPPQSVEVLAEGSPVLEMLNSWGGPGRGRGRRAW
jgi:predicted transcriptional regulator